MQLEGNTLINGEPTVGFTFMKMLAIHWSVLIKDFVAKYNLTTHEHSPYSSDLTPADFYLFP